MLTYYVYDTKNKTIKTHFNLTVNSDFFRGMQFVILRTTDNLEIIDPLSITDESIKAIIEHYKKGLL